MIQCAKLVETVSEAIIKYKEANFEHQDTAVCVVVRACTPEAADQLGIELDKAVPYYSGNNDNTEKVVIKNSRAVTLQHLALALVDKKMRDEGYQNNDGPIISSDIDEHLLEVGDVRMCAICDKSAEPGEIDVPRWAMVFIAVCDTSTIRKPAREAVLEGMLALKEYVKGEAKAENLIVNP